MVILFHSMYCHLKLYFYLSLFPITWQIHESRNFVIIVHLISHISPPYMPYLYLLTLPRPQCKPYWTQIWHLINFWMKEEMIEWVNKQTNCVSVLSMDSMCKMSFSFCLFHFCCSRVTHCKPAKCRILASVNSLYSSRINPNCKMLKLCTMFLICKLSVADAAMALRPSAAPYRPRNASCVSF